jgi:hypothetical protein
MQGTFRERSRILQGKGNIWRKSRDRSEKVQVTFREPSGNIQGTFYVYTHLCISIDGQRGEICWVATVLLKGLVGLLFARHRTPVCEHSGNIQGTFREHAWNIQGTFMEHSGNIQATFREHSGNS